MFLLSACTPGEEKPPAIELIAPEYDKITYYPQALIKAAKGDADTWWYLAENEAVSVAVPAGMNPWKCEADYIWTANQEGKNGIIDLGGQVILPCEYDKIQYLSEGDVFESYKRTDHGMQSTIFDPAGNVIHQFSIGDGNEVKVVSEQAFLVRQDFEYYLMDRKGQRISADTYSYGSTYEGSGYAALGDMSYVGKPGSKHIYKDDGSLALDESYEFVVFTGNETYPFLTRAGQNDDFYLMSASGDPVLTDYALHTIFKEEQLLPLTEQLFYYRRESEQKLLAQDGTVLHQSSYGPGIDGSYPVGRLNLEEDEYGLFFGNDRWIVIDSQGKEVLESVTAKAENMIYYGGSIIFEYGTDHYRLYNLETQELIYDSKVWEEISVMGNYYAVKDGDGYQVYDKNGDAAADVSGTVQAAYSDDAGVWVIIQKSGGQGVYRFRSFGR